MTLGRSAKLRQLDLAQGRRVRKGFLRLRTLGVRSVFARNLFCASRRTSAKVEAGSKGFRQHTPGMLRANDEVRSANRVPPSKFALRICSFVLRTFHFASAAPAPRSEAAKVRTRTKPAALPAIGSCSPHSSRPLTPCCRSRDTNGVGSHPKAVGNAHVSRPSGQPWSAQGATQFPQSGTAVWRS